MMISVVLACGAVRAGTVVDFGATCGKVKPVNGVGQPPMIGMPADAPLFHYLGEAGITVAVPLVGNFFTSLEMMGVTLSVLKLDDQLEGYMKAPCASIGLTKK